MTLHCEHCSYSTTRSFNLKRHISSRHKYAGDLATTPQSQSETTQSQNETKCIQNETLESQNEHYGFRCPNCHRKYAYRNSLAKHLPKCKGVKDPLECPSCHVKFPYRKALYRHRKTGCMRGPIQYPNDAPINNFCQENMLYITKDMAQDCLNMGWYGIISMIESIFFNPDHPENFNVKLTSLKNSLVQVKTTNAWKPRGLFDTIDTMIKRSSAHIICKAKPDDLATDQVVCNMDSINNIRSNAKRKIYDKVRALLVERRLESGDTESI